MFYSLFAGCERAKSADQPEAAEDADCPDVGPVQIRLPSSHPVLEKQPPHMILSRPSLRSATHHRPIANVSILQVETVWALQHPTRCWLVRMWNSVLCCRHGSRRKTSSLKGGLREIIFSVTLCFQLRYQVACYMIIRHVVQNSQKHHLVSWCELICCFCFYAILACKLIVFSVRDWNGRGLKITFF